MTKHLKIKTKKVGEFPKIVDINECDRYKCGTLVIYENLQYNGVMDYDDYETLPPIAHVYNSDEWEYFETDIIVETITYEEYLDIQRRKYEYDKGCMKYDYDFEYHILTSEQIDEIVDAINKKLKIKTSRVMRSDTLGFEIFSEIREKYRKQSKENFSCVNGSELEIYGCDTEKLIQSCLGEEDYTRKMELYRAQLRKNLNLNEDLQSQT